MDKLRNHIKDLERIEVQRRWWLFLSAAVTVAVGYIIFEWHIVRDLNLTWLVTALALLVSVLWWYWTMRVIRHFIDFRKDETEILIEIVHEVREIKDEVKKTFK